MIIAWAEKEVNDGSPTIQYHRSVPRLSTIPNRAFVYFGHMILTHITKEWDILYILYSLYIIYINTMSNTLIFWEEKNH